MRFRGLRCLWRRMVTVCVLLGMVVGSLAIATQAVQAQSQTLSKVQYSFSSVLASQHPAAWTVTMTVASSVYATDTFTLNGPPLSDGFEWSTLSGEYSATVTTGGSTTNVPITFVSPYPAELSTVVFSLGSGAAPVATAGSTVTVTVQGATNPGAGTYPASDFTAQVNSEPAVAAAQGATFGNATVTTDVSTDNLEAGASANWTIGLQSPVALTKGTGTLTLTGPLGLPSAARDYTLVDQTSGTTAQPPTAISVVSGGVQLTVPFAVYGGDTVRIGISGATNPPINDLNGGQFFPGAFEIAVSGASVPINVENPGAVLVSGQPDVTAAISSAVDGVPGVTWTVGFPAEAVLTGGDTLTIDESLPGVAFPNDTADYTITAGTTRLQPASVSATASGGGAQVVLMLPAGTNIPLQTQVSVQARAVTNPTATGAVRISLSTSRTTAGSVEPHISFVVPISTPGSGTNSVPGAANSQQVHLISGARPLPPEPLPPLSTTPNTPAALAFGSVCDSVGTAVGLSTTYCTGNMFLTAQSTLVNGEHIFIDPSRTVTIPVDNTTNQNNAYSNSSNITAATICASAMESGQSVQLACVDNLAPGAQSNLQFTLPGLASKVTFTATASGITNSPVTATPTGSTSSGPVVIVQSPTAMEQLNVLPFKILYQPPGNKSSAQFSLSQGSSTGASYSLGNTQSNTQTSSQNIGLSVSAGVTAGGFQGKLTASAGWDTKTSNTMTSGATTTKGVTVTTSNAQTWQAGPDPSLDTPGMQPWTGDEFVLLVHPQFAVWDNVTCASGVPSAKGGCATAQTGQVAYALYKANPSFLTVSAGQLKTCAEGKGSVPAGSYIPPVELMPNQCLSLLQLDPFAASDSQAVNPSAVSHLGGLATSVESSTANSTTTSTTIILRQGKVQTNSISSSSSISASVDSLFTVGAAASLGYSAGLGSLGSASVSAGISYSSSTGNNVTQTVNVQQSHTSQSTILQAASATLSDSSHPISTNIYLDTRWDTLMFQVLAPVVSSVSPSSGSPGMTVAIRGTGFTTGAAALRFCPLGGGACVASTILDPSTMTSDALTATVPTQLGAGTYTVQVVNSGGPSTVLCSSGTSCANFTVLPTIGSTGPSVAAVSPSTGPNGGGTTVTLTGAHLAGATAVWFGVSDPTQNPGDLQQFQQSGLSGAPPLAPSQAFRIISGTEILACAPPVSATGTLWVSVLGPDGWSPVAPGDAFKYTAGAATGTCDQGTLVGPPTVSSLSPATGGAQGGTTLTVYGSNFQLLHVTAPCDTAGCPSGGTVTLLEPPPVDFCALSGSSCVPGTEVKLVGANELTVQVPPGSGIVNVLVGGPAGFSQPAAADQYTFTAGTACTDCPGPGSLGLTVSPAAAAAGPGHAMVVATVLNTQDLPVPHAAVTFTTQGGSFTVGQAVYTDAAGVAEDTLTAGIPGTAVVDAVVPGTTELENQIAVPFLSLPVVTGLSTSSGPMAGGNPVTVEGTGLSGATNVYFGATAVPVAAGQVNGSGTAIRVTAPPGSGTVDVRVANAAAESGATASDRYTYVTGSLLAPQIVGLSPTAGPAGGGTVVTIRGSGFAGTTDVYFGSVQASSFQVVNGGEITATAPAGSGTVGVRVQTSYGGSAPGQNDTFSYTTPLQPVTRVLSAGWNTLSIPFPLAATSLDQILSNGGSTLIVAYAYANGGWVQVTSANQAQLLAQPMAGMFLDLAAGPSVTATLTPVSTPSPPPTLALDAGWNLVGPSSLSGPQDYATFLTGVSPAAVPLLVDPNGTPSAVTDPTAVTSRQVQPGYAYWVYAATADQALLGQAATGSTNP